MNGRPFKIYRIICTLTGKALVYGSDNCRWGGHHNPKWHERGQWGSSGAFWRTEETIKKHLLQLCHEWDGRGCYDEHPYRHWWVRISDKPDLSRLEHLKVETTTIADYSVAETSARDFLGVLEPVE